MVDLTTGMSIEAKRQIEELQKRLNVLERQNAQLKRAAAADDAGSGSGGGPGGGGGGPGGKGGRPSPVSTPAPAPLRASVDAERASASASAVAHWEETKKLNGRIDALKKKLAAKVRLAI